MVVDHHVAIIGAGLSGLGMAIALRRAGIEDIVLLERASDIGGTWRDNTYPGIAVDVPAQVYQFSFELNPDWSRIFAPGAEVKAYIDHIADRYDLRRFVRFDTEVLERVWDEDEQRWRLRTPGGEVTARFVVSAIGAFVDPKPAEIPGLADFAGKVIYSSRWDHDYDLAGKRAAIVGTGASAVQIIPEIASRVDHLDVYQRTPIWVAPKIDPGMPALVSGLFRRLPGSQRAVRELATRAVEFVLIDAVIRYRPIWARAIATSLRELWYRSQVPDPQLRDKLTPRYGFGCKRPAVSSSYLKTFTRPHVELVTDAIEEVTSSGLRTADGRERPVDVLILATGFRLASDPENFRRTPVRGRDGFDLATAYTERRLTSYEGVSMPGLPNHFMMFGPYGWVGATWHQLVESTSAHIVRVIGEADRRGATSVEVRPEASRRWTERMRRRLAGSLFNTNNCASANSYYFDHHGDTPYLRPTSSAQAFTASRDFPLDDYRFTTAGNVSPTPAPATARRTA